MTAAPASEVLAGVAGLLTGRDQFGVRVALIGALGHRQVYRLNRAAAGAEGEQPSGQTNGNDRNTHISSSCNCREIASPPNQTPARHARQG
jgi:hypothetical protein